MAGLKGSIIGGIQETVILDELIYRDDEDDVEANLGGGGGTEAH